MSLSLLLDSVVILLLLATIGYAAVLNRRLARLRAAKTEMEKLFKDFGGAAADALEALSSLSTEGQGRLKDLDRRIEQGRALADDLVFLIERGNKLADGLCAPSAPNAGAVEDKPERKGASGVAALKAQARNEGAQKKGAAPWLKSLEGMR